MMHRQALLFDVHPRPFHSTIAQLALHGMVADFGEKTVSACLNYAATEPVADADCCILKALVAETCECSTTRHTTQKKRHADDASFATMQAYGDDWCSTYSDD